MDTSDLCHLRQEGLAVRDGYVSVLQDEADVLGQLEGVRRAFVQVFLLHPVHSESDKLCVRGRVN